MKKGTIPLAVFIIGVIVVFIIGAVFIPKIPKIYRENIAPVFGIVPKDDSSVVDVKTFISPYLELVADSKKAVKQLAEEASFCWVKMKASEVENLFCKVVLPVSLKGSIKKKDVLNFLKSINEPAYNALSADWQVPSVISEFTPAFYICADYESMYARDMDRDLLFTYDNSSCSRVEKMEFTPYPVPPTVDMSNFVMKALIDCWVSVKEDHYVGPCAYFDSSYMRSYSPDDSNTFVKKRFVIGNLKELEKNKVIPEGAASTLDDWWMINENAFMEYTINEFSKPFFVCGRFQGWPSVSDLCLTHDINNECCKD